MFCRIERGAALQYRLPTPSASSVVPSCSFPPTPSTFMTRRMVQLSIWERAESSGVFGMNGLEADEAAESWAEPAMDPAEGHKRKACGIKHPAWNTSQATRFAAEPRLASHQSASCYSGQTHAKLLLPLSSPCRHLLSFAPSRLAGSAGRQQRQSTARARSLSTLTSGPGSHVCTHQAELRRLRLSRAPLARSRTPWSHCLRRRKKNCASSEETKLRGKCSCHFPFPHFHQSTWREPKPELSARAAKHDTRLQQSHILGLHRASPPVTAFERYTLPELSTIAEHASSMPSLSLHAKNQQ